MKTKLQFEDIKKLINEVDDLEKQNENIEDVINNIYNKNSSICIMSDSDTFSTKVERIYDDDDEEEIDIHIYLTKDMLVTLLRDIEYNNKNSIKQIKKQF